MPIGGELVNSYESIKLLGRMLSFNCGCRLWLGVTDMADERGTSRSSWQMVSNNGFLPLNDSLWNGADPNNVGGVQDCLSQSPTYSEIIDLQCSELLGFSCEFSSSSKAESLANSSWRLTPFKHTSFNPSSEYCHTDLLQVKNAMHCVAAAMRAGNSRAVLYNSKLRACRLLLFIDAQVKEEIEMSANWVKFSIF